MELSFEPDGWWPYALVFLAAATPVLEVLVVVPAAVVAGMPPVAVTLLALAGNLSTVVLIGVAGDRVIGVWKRRRGASEHEADRLPSPEPGRRAQRAQELARRWGVPGLAFLAPLTTGTHIATLAALATGARTRPVLGWMTVGLAFWSVTAALVTSMGVTLLG